MSRRYQNPLSARFKKEFFSSIPLAAGVYFMKSARGEVLYIGKATSLRKRIRSYCNARPDTVGQNILRLLERVRKIEWEVHASEQEAFSRELELIRAFVPRYNIADAWEERYLFIGMRVNEKKKLEFRLTYKLEDARDFELHGCYPRRGVVKKGYSALLRILHACFQDSHRFSFPAKLTRPSPAYEYSLALPDPKKWKKILSDFFHGQKSSFLSIVVQELLKNEKIPEYVRPGLQRDIGDLVAFEKLCLRLAKSYNKEQRRTLSHEEMRLEIQKSVLIELSS